MNRCIRIGRHVKELSAACNLELAWACEHLDFAMLSTACNPKLHGLASIKFGVSSLRPGHLQQADVALKPQRSKHESQMITWQTVIGTGNHESVQISKASAAAGGRLQSGRLGGERPRTPREAASGRNESLGPPGPRRRQAQQQVKPGQAYSYKLM